MKHLRKKNVPTCENEKKMLQLSPTSLHIIGENEKIIQKISLSVRCSASVCGGGTHTDRERECVGQTYRKSMCVCWIHMQSMSHTDRERESMSHTDRERESMSHTDKERERVFHIQKEYVRALDTHTEYVTYR